MKQSSNFIYKEAKDLVDLNHGVVNVITGDHKDLEKLAKVLIKEEFKRLRNVKK